jgi:hypothetical protein
VSFCFPSKSLAQENDGKIKFRVNLTSQNLRFIGSEFFQKKAASKPN